MFYYLQMILGYLSWVSFSILFLYSQRAMDAVDTEETVGFLVPPVEEAEGFPWGIVKTFGFSALVMFSAVLQYEMIRRNRNARIRQADYHSIEDGTTPHSHHHSKFHEALEIVTMAPPFALITAVGVKLELERFAYLFFQGNLPLYIELSLLIPSAICGGVTGYGAYLIHTIHANDGEEGPLSFRNFFRSLRQAATSGLEFSMSGLKNLWYKVGIVLGHLCEPFFVGRLTLDHLFVPLLRGLVSIDEDSITYQVLWGTLTVTLAIPMILEINSELRSMRIIENTEVTQHRVLNFLRRHFSLPALVGYLHALPHVLGISEGLIFLLEKILMDDLGSMGGPFEAQENNETFHHVWIFVFACALGLLQNAHGFRDMIIEVFERTSLPQEEQSPRWRDFLRATVYGLPPSNIAPPIEPIPLIGYEKNGF